jgi:hypothetical protein
MTIFVPTGRFDIAHRLVLNWQAVVSESED